MKNENKDEIEPRTMGSIIYEKYLDQLERSSLDKILDVSGRIALGVTFSTAMILGGELRNALMANDMLALKVITGMGLGWYRRPAIEIAGTIKAHILDIIHRESSQEVGVIELSGPTPLLVDGVKVETIADYIFTSRNFKREGAEKIGVGRTQADKISKGLERVGALVRGEKNSRILAEGYDLESLVLVLSNYVEFGEFTTTERMKLGDGFKISRLELEGVE